MFKGRMLRIIITLLAVMPLLLAASPTSASPSVWCFIDGQELISDPAPFITNGRTMVPLRAVGEGLDMEVEWLDDVRVARIHTNPMIPRNPLPPLTDRHSTAKPLIFINDLQIPSDVDPVIVDGRIMVPIRVITENMGMEVEWDESVRHVYITRPEPPVVEPEEPEPAPAEPELPVPGTEPPPVEEPSPPAIPEHLYLGISIMGNPQASPAEMARVAFDAVAARIYPGISESETAVYINRAQDYVRQQYDEVTTWEVVRLTSEINKSRAEVMQYSPAQRDEILDFVATTYYKLAQMYLQKGLQYGIRGDIAFFQAAHETGWWRFGGLVTPEQNNYCGLSATGQPATAEEDLRGANPARVYFVEGRHGAFFDTPATGVEAQLQHLYAYATTQDLPAGVDLLSPRYTLVRKGIAPNWEDLGGKWAVPGYPRGAPHYYENMPDPFAAAFVNGQTYGQTILAYYFRTGLE